VAGPIADRFDRRWLIVRGNLAEGALMATIPIASAAGALTIGQIYVVALLAHRASSSATRPRSARCLDSSAPSSCRMRTAC